uniref:transcription factor MYBS3 isoform X1 n=1 Tax=Erigeron canadensis TaxID=72917 RepID=UPI001CB9BF85|nr:transcription factor MYBS3 isoform X1 [Erigeron canadensis]
MGRKCSHCGNIGHNSRTCTNYNINRGTTTTNVNSTTIMVGSGGGGLRLFGVQLDSPHSMVMMKKCLSMDCFDPSSSSSNSPLPTASASSHSPSSSSLSSSRVSLNDLSSEKTVSVGYLSDGLIARAQERKKGLPWSEEEHRRFLSGLEKLGKGDWRGISRNFVNTRTPTQVASHAQKYFLRQASLLNKKQLRRSSLFDLQVRGNQNKNVPLLLQQNQEKSSDIQMTTSSVVIDHEEHHQDHNNIDSSRSSSLKQENNINNINDYYYNDINPTVVDMKKSAAASKCSSLVVVVQHPTTTTTCQSDNLDLELTLATAPKPIIIMDRQQNKQQSSTTTLQLGPVISVT